MSNKTWSLPQHLWTASLLVVTYCVTARAALWFTSIGSNAALFWPPSGIAVAALLLGGLRLAPALLVAALATNAWSGYSVWGLVAVSLGSTAEAVVAASALQRTGFRNSLSRVQDVLLFIVFAVLLSPLLAALAGAGTLWAEGRLAGGTAAGTGLAWFLGDATGTLIVGPAVLLWYSSRSRWDRAFESLALLLGLVSAGFVALSYSASALPSLMLHICQAFLIWAAVRFGERGVAGTGIVLAIIAAWLIADSQGVTQTTSMHGSLIFLQSYLGVGVASALLLASTLSERGAKEQELQKSQDMLAAAQRLARMGNFEWDVTTNQANWSEELYRIYGLQPDQFGASFEAFLERVHPADRSRVRDGIGHTLLSHERFLSEVRIVRADGSERILATQANVELGAGGRSERLVGICRDITEERQATEQLRASEERFRALTEHSHDVITILAADGTIEYQGGATESLLGYKADELVGQKAFGYVHPDDLPTVVQRLQLLMHGTPEFHGTVYRFRHKNGSWKTFESVGTNLLNQPSVRGLVINSRDITERKLAEEALNEARNRIVLAVRAGKVGLWDWNLLSNECSFSAEWKAQIGYEAQEITDRYEEWEVRIHPDDLDETLRSLRAALAPPWPHYAVEFRLRHKDGSYRWILAQGSLEFNAEGAPVRMLGSHVDVTERKQAELERQAAIAELSRSEERFSKLFYASPFSIMLATFPEGRIIAANPEFLRLFKLGEDVIGKTTTEIHLWANSPDREIMLQRLRNDEPVRSMEFVFCTRSGETRILLLSVELVELSGQKHALAMSIDITERRQAEQALAESELRYRTLAETMPDSLSVANPDGNITYASPSAARLFGNKSEDELLGRNVFEWIPGAERERAGADLQGILAGGTLSGEEYRLARSDGSLFHGAVSATALRDPSGRPSGIVILIRDISERKEAQEALRRSEARYHALAQAAHDIIFIARADGTLEYANDEAARRFRTTPKAIVGQRMSELLSSGGAQQEQSVRTVLETGDPLYQENLFHLPDGPVWLGIWLIPLRDEDGRVTAVLAQARDITERKEKEQAVAAAKLRLELAIEQSRISIWEADVRAGTVYLSREWQATLGAENAEETFTTLAELLKLVPPEDLPGMRTAMVNALKGIHPRYSVEHHVRALDGSWKWIHSHGRVVERDAGGRALRLAGTNTDISENKRAEAAVQESEAKFRTLVEQSLAGIYIIQDGRFVYVNQRCAEIHGRTVEEMLSLPSVFDVVTQPDLRTVREKIAQRISGGVTSINYAFSIQRKDGQVRELEVFGSRTDLEGRPAIIGTALDVTERRQRQLEIERLNTELEDRVAMRTSQLEAANRELEAFSYSVSHDLRAPLRHISGFVKLLEGEAGPALTGRSREYFDEVTNAALRMGKLIDDLLDFARIGKLELSKRRLSLKGVFEEVAGSFASECAGRKVVWKFGALPEVSADATLLRQAIWNLLSNAVKYTRTCSEAVIEVGCLSDERHSVTCYIRDNGAGFDAKYAHKLFGVFQRLHSAAQFEGTGIGLANVQRIVHRHGGRVWGEGKVNAGATFYFSLPKS